MNTRNTVILQVLIFIELAEFSVTKKIRCETPGNTIVGKLQYSVQKLEEEAHNLDGLGLKRQGIPGAPENPFISNIMQSENLTSMLIKWTTPGDDSVRALRGFTVSLSDTLDTTGRIFTYLIDIRNNTSDVLYNHMGDQLSLKCEYGGTTKYERYLQINIESLPQSSNPSISDKSVSLLVRIPKFVISDTSTVSIGRPQDTLSPQVEIIIGVFVTAVVIASVVMTIIYFLKTKGPGIMCNQIKRGVKGQNLKTNQNYEVATKNGNFSQDGNRNNATLKTQFQERGGYIEYTDEIDARKTEKPNSKNWTNNCPVHGQNPTTYRDVSNQDLRSSLKINSITYEDTPNEDLRSSLNTNPITYEDTPNEDRRSSWNTNTRTYEDVPNECSRSSLDDLMETLAKMNFEVDGISV